VVAHIKNSLIVIGNKVLVPGHEPLSEQTTSALSVAYIGVSSFIDLDLALELIPGSTVQISTLDSGTFGHNKRFVLPEGPPPNGSQCPRNCFPDWYEILREAAKFATTDCSSPFLGGECDSYDSSGCDFSDFSNSLDPVKRDNCGNNGYRTGNKCNNLDPSKRNCNG
jgi:hypothetical protein